MPKITIKVLAKDFENNSWCNVKEGIFGCPLERAFTRAGYTDYMKYIKPEHPANERVCKMFYGEEKVKNFQFKVDIP